MKKLLFILAAFIVLTSSVSAHVVVKPAEVGIGVFQTFTMIVPNEKDNPTVAVRLSIPESLSDVSPNVKLGWKIDIKKSSGENPKITEITWSEGTIPSGMRDDFILSAQVPTKQTTLKWKAYQMYQDGTVVEWTHTPGKNGSDDDNAPPSYSQTKIVNDLKANTTPSTTDSKDREVDKTLIYASLALSAAALAISLRNRK